MQYSIIRRENALKWHSQFACKSVCYGLAAALLFSAGSAYAAQNQSAAAEQIYSETEGWHLGLATGYGRVSNPVFQRADIPFYLLPRLEYFHGDFAWSNTQLSWTPWQTDYGNVGFITYLNSDGLYFISHTHTAAILYPIARPPGATPPKSDGTGNNSNTLKRGDITKIASRHLSYSAGIDWSLNLANWHFDAMLVQDISSVHNGLEAFAHIDYQQLYGNHQAALGLELNYQSAELTRYYYGTHAQDYQAGFGKFRAQSNLNVALSARYQYGWDDNWRLISELKYQWLGNGIQHSPLLDEDTVISAFVGIAWSF